jgi:hypothetical protein
MKDLGGRNQSSKVISVAHPGKPVSLPKNELTYQLMKNPGILCRGFSKKL